MNDPQRPVCHDHRNPDRDLDRRAFLRCAAGSGLALAASPLLPAASDPLASSPLRTSAHWLPRGDARTLVVLELEGGNDGLNTVVPVDDAAFARLRPTLSAVRTGAHPVGAGFALHPSLAALAARLNGGTAAVVHGVGYDPPDRSHFRSRDIWHTADPAHRQVRADTTGWLGRAADVLAAAGAATPAASLGDLEVPLLLHGRRVVVPSLDRIEDQEVRTTTGDAATRDALIALAGAIDPGRDRNDALAHAARTGAAAIRQAEALRQELQGYAARADYPDSDLGRTLQLCARLAVSGFGTRLFHLGFGGFDTHAQQLPTHAGLLRQLDLALGAFLDDLDGHGRLQDTVVLVHSEFGRRVAENQSLGTDHGTGAPVLLFGGDVATGLHGTPPDLTDLRDGDVHATVDFRAVYQDLLRWLAIDPAAVLGAELPALDLLSRRPG